MMADMRALLDEERRTSQQRAAEAQVAAATVEQAMRALHLVQREREDFRTMYDHANAELRTYREERLRARGVTVVDEL
jgi:hypothetical protein